MNAGAKKLQLLMIQTDLENCLAALEAEHFDAAILCLDNAFAKVRAWKASEAAETSATDETPKLKQGIIDV